MTDIRDMLMSIKTKDDVLSLPWNEVQLRETRGMKGVYAILSDGEIVYIGKSHNISRRLYATEHPAHNCDNSSFLVLPIADPCMRGYCEYRLIDVLKPKLNRRGGQLDAGRVPEDVLQAYYDRAFK